MKSRCGSVINRLGYYRSVAVSDNNGIYAVTVVSNNVDKIVCIGGYGSFREIVKENCKLLSDLNRKIVNFLSFKDFFINGKLSVGISLLALKSLFVISNEKLVCNLVRRFVDLEASCDNVSVKIGKLHLVNSLVGEYEIRDAVLFLKCEEGVWRTVSGNGIRNAVVYKV